MRIYVYNNSSVVLINENEGDIQRAIVKIKRTLRAFRMKINENTKMLNETTNVVR